MKIPAGAVMSEMSPKPSVIVFLCLCLLLESVKADPGRDVCKIFGETGLKCSKIFSYLFPYDIFLSFNDDVNNFTNEMKYLEIGSSNISVLQARSFQPTPSLSHLVLSKIYLMEIESGAFEGLRRLKLLDLSYNLLQTIPVDTFKYTKLNRLILEGNAFLEIPTNSPIVIAKHLTSFSLKNCNIHFLPASAFQQTPSLIHLDLSQNYLQLLPQDIFSNLKHLNFVDLSSNQFSSLDINVFKAIPSFPKFPTTVILSENPWVCDCKISEVGDWAAKNVKNGTWSETPELSRLKKLVQCQEPQRMSWNSLSFKKIISSC